MFTGANIILFKGVDFSMEKPDQLDREVDAGRRRGAMARRVPAPTTHTQHAPVQNMHKDNLFYTRDKTGNDPLPTV